MTTRGDFEIQLPFSTQMFVRWCLLGFLTLGIGSARTFGWISGPLTARFSIKHYESSSCSALFATCRICRKQYDPLFNEALSCVFHPGSLRGESPRKSDWEDESYDEDGKRKLDGPQKSIDNSQLVYTYTCCGGTADAEGCTRGKCKSFDDP